MQRWGLQAPTFSAFYYYDQQTLEISMTTLSTYNTLRNLPMAEAEEFLVSKVNRSDLLQIEGFADFDDNSDLAYVIYKVRTSA